MYRKWTLWLAADIKQKSIDSTQLNEVDRKKREKSREYFKGVKFREKKYGEPGGEEDEKETTTKKWQQTRAASARLNDAGTAVAVAAAAKFGYFIVSFFNSDFFAPLFFVFLLPGGWVKTLEKNKKDTKVCLDSSSLTSRISSNIHSKS